MQSRRRRGSRSPSCRPQGRCRCMTRSGRSPHRGVGQVVVAALEMSRVGARIGSGILGHQFEGMENRVAYLTEVQVGSLKALLYVLGVVAGLLAYDIAEHGGVSIVVVLIVFPQASHVGNQSAGIECGDDQTLLDGRSDHRAGDVVVIHGCVLLRLAQYRWAPGRFGGLGQCTQMAGGITPRPLRARHPRLHRGARARPDQAAPGRRYRRKTEPWRQCRGPPARRGREGRRRGKTLYRPRDADSRYLRPFGTCPKMGGIHRCAMRNRDTGGIETV